MATIQKINGVLTTLTATPYTSGTAVVVSGTLGDEKLNILVQPEETALECTLTLSAGDYLSATDYTATVPAGSAADGVYVMTGMDGTKYRQSDGTYSVTVNASGNLYFWTTGHNA